MSGLSILTIAWFPPAGADAGDRRRMEALARHLGEQPGVAESAVLSFSDDRPRGAGGGYHADPASAVLDLRSPVVVANRYPLTTRLRAAVGPRSAYELVLANPRTRRVVADVLAERRPDVVIVHGLAAWPLVPEAWWSRSVYDSQNAELLRLGRSAATSGRLKGWVVRRESVFAGRLEARMATQAAQVWCCTAEDEAYFAGLGGRAVVIPNGAFEPTERWSPPTSVPDPTGTTRTDRPLRLVSIASLHYSPNVDGYRWFAQTWARAETDPWTLEVVGSGDPTTVTKIFADVPQATVVGRVEDISAAYAGADALLVPLRQGGGSRLKAVEALTHGTPMISTAVGVEGLGLEPGRHYLRAETPEDFAAVLRQIRADPGLLARVSAAGLEVAGQFAWSTIARDAYAALETITSPQRA